MTLEEVKTVTEIFAFAGASVFFTYKVFVGYFLPNLTLSPACERSSFNDNLDILVIKLSVHKGGLGALVFTDIQARIKYGDEDKRLQFIGTERLSFHLRSHLDSYNLANIDWDHKDRNFPHVALSPDEATVFSCFCEVPRTSICKIEIALIATKPRSLIIRQWKASLVSVPIL
jgi:hypothetical protein